MVRKKIAKKSVSKKVAGKKVSLKKSASKKRSVQNKVVSLNLKSGGLSQMDAKKLGNSIGKVFALCVFIVSVFAMYGKMDTWRILVDAVYGPLGYWPGTFLLGIVWGTVLAYIDGFIVGWLIAKIYNKPYRYCIWKK